MLERRFPICSTPVPQCLGRGAILDKMAGALTRPNPSHLQVIGPRFSGKTVILTELVCRMQNAKPFYSAVFLWDLAHLTVVSDEQFTHFFGKRLSEALGPMHAAYKEHLEAADTVSFDEIAEVLDLLAEEGCRVLSVWDGFDKISSQSSLTRNVWDQFRELAVKPSLRLVTSSRRRLSELIRDPDAETSPFWNIFESNHVIVKPFDDQELEVVVGQAAGIRLTNGARTELLNATNGSPLLTLEVLNTLLAAGAKGDVSPEQMCAACDGAFPALRDRIGLLWGDCSQEAKDLFCQVWNAGSVARGEVSTLDAETLIERGFVHSVANKLQRASRLLGVYLKEQPNESGALGRLFGTPDAYRQNFRSVLERRISLIRNIDPKLKHYLQRGIEDLPDEPEVFLGHIRAIADHGFELIWKAEIPDKKVPADWLQTWKDREEPGVEALDTVLPQGGKRVRLLFLMTSPKRSAPRAKFIKKGTTVLMNAIQSFGDFGQHRDGEAIDLGTAYAALLLCIEVAAALARELPASSR